MKIAALAPQFVIAAPEGEESKDADRVQRKLAIAKVQGAEPAAAGDGGGGGSPAHDETRSGLKRLAQFISKQRRAPEHDQPKPSAHELHEKRAAVDSHEYMRMWMEWSRRPRVINSMAQVIADEMKRRRGLKEYKRMQAVRKKQAPALPVLVNF